MPPVVMLKTPVDPEMLEPTQKGISTLCPLEPHEGWRAFQLLAAQALPAMAPQAAFDIQRLTETALTIKESYESIQPHGLEVWRVEERIAHEAHATSLFLAREALATADIQRLRNATGSLIDQTTTAQAAVLIETARFQKMMSSMAEETARFQQFQKELWASLPPIDLRWKEERERLQTLIDPPGLAAKLALAGLSPINHIESGLFSAAPFHNPIEDDEAFQEELQRSIDMTTVVNAYCPLYQEHHQERQQDDQLNAALTRLIAQLSPGLRNPRAAQALRQQAAARHTSPQALLRTEVFPEAIALVAREVATPQRMRVGRDWAVNRNGKVQVASPSEALPVRAFDHWFFSQVYAAAVAIVLGEVYPRPITQSVRLVWCEEEALERLAVPESPGARDSATLTALLYDAEGDDQLHHLLTVASPRARELLLLLQQGLSRNKAAQVMGISRSTVDVVLCRLRKKVHRR